MYKQTECGHGRIHVVCSEVELQQIYPQPPGLHSQLNSCGLVIKKASKEDDGEWRCKMLVESSNFHSQPVEKVALLRIREKITNLFGLGKSSKKTLYLHLNHSAHLRINACPRSRAKA